MRLDKNLRFDLHDFYDNPNQGFSWGRPETGTSFSGNERNHLFLSESGQSFWDISGVSGLDSPSDGRSFAILDYDQDGWLDIVLVNSNMPLLQLFRNRIGEQPGARGEVVALRFVGGNKTPLSSEDWSARDGYGALVTLTLGNGTRLIREHRCGEGMAAQNSSTMVIGIGEADGVGPLVVRWPSGRVQELPSTRAGSLITIYENPDDSPDGSAFVRSNYGAR